MQNGEFVKNYFSRSEFSKGIQAPVQQQTKSEGNMEH